MAVRASLSCSNGPERKEEETIMPATPILRVWWCLMMPGAQAFVGQDMDSLIDRNASVMTRGDAVLADDNDVQRHE